MPSLRAAEVSDEGSVYRSPEEIRARPNAVGLSVDRRRRPRRERDGDRHVITTRLSGDSPGSPVEVPYHFTLRDGLISGLDIDP